MVEPNHLQRSLDILAGLPRLDDPDAVSAYLERDEAPELDEGHDDASSTSGSRPPTP